MILLTHKIKGGIFVKKKYEPPAIDEVKINAPDIIMASTVRLTGVTMEILSIDAVEIYK